jgi:CubicO group peptidase (beta-lactamase class C family)
LASNPREWFNTVEEQEHPTQWRMEHSSDLSYKMCFQLARAKGATGNGISGIKLHCYQFAQVPTKITAIVIPTEDHAYLSIFRDDSVGAWDARHGLSSADYQTAFNQFTARGELPLDVHGGGSGSNAVYAAVFAKQVDTVPRAWTITGATAPHEANLDAAVKTFMQRWGIRSGTLAVAKSNSVKFARAYAWAEPGYEITQPDSEFRLASVSKAFTCASIKTLADANKFKMTDKVFPTLGITQVALPSQTADPHTNDISIQNLVDHAGGWLPDAPTGFHPEFNLRKISTDLGLSGPPSERDLARYMFGMPLQFVPGTEDYGSTNGASYSNFGYILLGLIVERYANQPYADYVRQHILAPLGITDLHLARTLAAQKAADEVHYHSANLGNPSYNASSDALVPGAYGGSGFMTETMDSAGRPYGDRVRTGSIRHRMGILGTRRTRRRPHRRSVRNCQPYSVLRRQCRLRVHLQHR